MIGKKILEAKKQEFELKEFVKARLGKGRISQIKIERTPVGEKIVITTAKPGLVIGHRGEAIQEINDVLKKKFKLENPQIEVQELIDPEFDAQTVADSIASALEHFGPLGFKLIAYRELRRLIDAGALGAEFRLNGKLPSERSKSWRFAFGYLKKTGEISSIVRKAQATAFTRPGAVGIRVTIVPKGTKMSDKIEINREAAAREIGERLAAEEARIGELKEGEEKKDEEKTVEKAGEKKEPKKKARKKKEERVEKAEKTTENKEPENIKKEKVEKGEKD